MNGGYITLFFSALGAATILPFSSEAVLIALLQSGEYDTSLLIASASAGNISGSIINWILGFQLLKLKQRPWFPFNERGIERASQQFRRYGVLSLLLAWVPLIGDPLTLIAGFFKTPFLLFLLLVSIGKIGRYLVLAGLF
jgi:membrane protein YqaA with SNARE-associated domain